MLRRAPGLEEGGVAVTASACDPRYGPVPPEFYLEQGVPALGDPVMEYLHSD